MTARTRALVSRPGRKIHWATLGPGETAWIGVGCSLDVPVFGATVHGSDWPAFLNTATDDEQGRMCSRCRVPLLVASLALEEVDGIRASNLDREALVEEVRTLRAELSRWTTAALAEVRVAAARRFRPVAR